MYDLDLDPLTLTLTLCGQGSNSVTGYFASNCHRDFKFGSYLSL